MGLSNGQRDDVRNFLISRGLAFKPLLDEMSDHINCDIEEKMSSGLSYDDAWAATINELPEDHFKLIQQETMETINRRFNLSRVFTYVALGAMLVATIFKILHLNGADEALLLSFVALSASLLTGSVSGVYLNRDKQGAVRVIGVVAGVFLMTIGYSFKILHLPGADPILVLAVAVLLIAMFANTLYVYKHASGNGNLFTFLHEKYSPGIERFLLILTAIIVCFGTFKLFSEGIRGITIINVVAIYAAGLQLISLTWRSMEQDLSRRNMINLVTIVVAFICLSLPMLTNVLAFEIRLTAVTLFNVAAAILAFRIDPARNASSFIAIFVAAVFVALCLAKFGIAAFLMPNLAVHVVVVILTIAGIFLSERNSVTRMFLIISLAGYFIEIP